MPFPVSYFDAGGEPIEGAAGAAEVFRNLNEAGAYEIRSAIKALHRAGFAITRVCDPFGGQIARVQIDAYGESAAECESTLLEYATRCDAAAQASEVTYGRCVIERNLAEEWGTLCSWRGRLVLHPIVGVEGSPQRAAAAVIGEALDRDPR